MVNPATNTVDEEDDVKTYNKDNFKNINCKDL